MPFYLYAWIATMLFSVSSITSKLASKHQITNPYLLNFAWSLVGNILIILLALNQGVNLSVHWFNLIGISVLAALNGILYVLAMYALDVSVFGPLYNLKTVFTIFLGVLFLGENLSPVQWFFALIIIIFGFLVSFDERFSWRSLLSKNIALGVISILFSSVVAAGFKYVQIFDSYWNVIFWSAVISQFILFFSVPLFRQDLKKIKLRNYSGIVVTAVISALAWLAIIKASAVNVSITTAISCIPLQIIFAFIFSRVAPELLEKHPLKVYLVRFAATGVMVWAAIALSR